MRLFLQARRLVLLAFLFSSSLVAVKAQMPVAELHSIHPPIVKAGATTEISLTGKFLEELSELHFSTSGITGKPIMLPASKYRKYPVQNGSRASVTIPADTKPQTIEVWANGYHGVSTSRPLVIVPSDASVLKDSAGANHHKIATAPELTRNAFAYGTTDSRQVDWWRFAVKKGERILFTCQAEQIDSQADATLKVVDGRGYELTTNRDRIGRDPVIDFTAPADGNYWVGVHDVFYNGGINFTYILQGSVRPWIDAVFPPSGKAGETYTATLIGRNLPGGSPGEGLVIDGRSVETRQVKIKVPTAQVKRFHWANPAQAMQASFPYQFEHSNAVSIGIASYPVKSFDIDQVGEPQIEVPAEIVSRFDGKDDSDYYRFLARKGVGYSVEVIGDRISGAVDPYLMLDTIEKNKDGAESFKRYKAGDDLAGVGGTTFRDGSRDTVLTISRADQDREFRIGVINQFAQGGPEKSYRIVLRETNPDFEIMAVGSRNHIEARQAFPAVPHLRKGGSFGLRLLVNRKDGFSEPITVSAKGLPEGVTCHSVVLSAKESTGRMVFTAAPSAKPWSGSIQLVGKAKHGEAEVERTVQFASLVWAANDYNTTRTRPRLNLQIPLSVTDKEISPASLVLTDRNLKVELGKKLEIPIKVTKNAPKGNLAVTVSGLRGLKKPPTINIAEKATDGKLVLTFTKNGNFNPEVGTWNFLLKGTGITKYKKNPDAYKRAIEEQKHIAALLKKYTDATAKAKADLQAKKKELTAAEANLSTASPDAKAQLEKAVSSTRQSVSVADNAVKTATANQATAQREKAAADKRVAAAKNASAAKDTKFTVWSEPLTVTVTPAPPKPKKK